MNPFDLLNKKDGEIPPHQIRYFLDYKTSNPGSVSMVKKIEKAIDNSGYFVEGPDVINSTYYHILPGISSSGLQDFLVDKKLFEYNLKNIKTDVRVKKHFHIGQAVHAVLTGTGKIISKYEYLKDKKGVNFSLDQARLVKDNIYLIDDKDYQMIETWVKGCMESDHVSSIFNSNMASYESSIFTRCKESGLLIKFRPDVLDVSRNVIVDIKTDSGLNRWPWVVDERGYAIQQAFYLYCCEMAFNVRIRDFVFLCLSKRPPYRVSVKAIKKARIDELIKKIPNILVDMDTHLRIDGWGSIVDDEIEYAE